MEFIHIDVILWDASATMEFICESLFNILKIFSTNPMQRIEKTFQLTRADMELLAKQEYDVQVVG